MALQAVQSKSLPDQVFEQLAKAIVAGRYETGATLPSERDLSDVFAVNRHVVREAVKRLEQVGLVRVAQGGRTKVLDFRRTAGLDLLGVMAEHVESAELALPLARAALEMRAAIGIDLARLCALRADESVKADLVAIADELPNIPAGPELLAADQRFWNRVLDGADNLAYRLAFNSLIRSVDAMPDATLVGLTHELDAGDYRRPIAAAIAAGDAEAAVAATRAALEPTVTRLAEFIDADGAVAVDVSS